MQPSAEPSPPPQGRAGFALPLDIFLAPARAFRTIEATREWLPAYAVLVGLGLFELYLLAPALAHVLAAPPHGGSRPDAATVRETMVLEGLWRVLGPPIAWGFVATLLAAASFGTRTASIGLGVFFSLAMNCAIPAAVGGVILALAVRLHDPSTFRNISDLQLAAPINLGALRPHGSPREIAFLSYWDVFTLWSLVLLGYGFAAIAKMRQVPALLFALGVGLSFALMQAAPAP